MSSSIEELYQRLLASGLSEEELEKELEHKSKEFGGFMTKQGILFIIAKERGINPYNYAFYKELEEMIDYDEFSITIAEVQEQMTNILLLGKVQSFTPPREFVRKDSSVGKVSSFILADWTGSIKIVLWGEGVSFTEHDAFKEGVLVRVIGGYAKVGTNDAVEVHLGKKGRLVVSPQDVSQKLMQQLEHLEKKASPEKPLSSRDTIATLVEQYKYIKSLQGEVQCMDFKEITKKTGEKTFLLKLIISDGSTTIPLLIWGMPAVDALKVIEEGCIIRVGGISVRENTYSHEKELQFTKKSSLKVI